MDPVRRLQEPNSVSPYAAASRGLTLVWLLVIAGCRTIPESEQLPQFREGLASVDQRTAQAFADINAFDRQRMIDFAATQSSLDENHFQLVLESDDTEKWKRAFGLIDEYAQLLQKLLDPKLRDGLHTELVVLGEQMGKVRDDELPAGVVSGIASLAGLLVQMTAEQDAMKAIRSADPAIRATFTSMTTAIGDDQKSGVRGASWAAWTKLLASRVLAFQQTSDVKRRREIAAQFAADLDGRDAQDRSLNSIRRSLDLLSQAHAELAAGRTQGAAGLLELVNAEYARWSTTKSDLEKAREAAAKTEGAGK
ncbi:MAG: hypothetical protein ABL934_00635 [Lysobacteraceae bacterium]